MYCALYQVLLTAENRFVPATATFLVTLYRVECVGHFGLKAGSLMGLKAAESGKPFAQTASSSSTCR
jgi:hypothetical protein